jgi:glycerate kinase
MRIVVATDSFKGSLTASEACAAMQRGIGRALPDAEVIVVPMADGGEGTTAALVAATGGCFVEAVVTGPLGERVEAQYGLLGDKRTAVIEMAAASGLLLVPPDRRNPLLTTTFGTGELIREALHRGAERIVIGIGGSATNDGGAGMIQALGGRLLRADGSPIPPGGEGLLQLDRIDLAGLDPRLAHTELLVACDVDNPLCGPGGAAAVYGPQKGASSEMVALLDSALGHFADIMAHEIGTDLRDAPGAGAAGGLGLGLMGFLHARLRPGIEVVMEAVQLERVLQGAALVLTGEGRTDGQTLAGKVPLGVARLAHRLGIPTVVISGSIGEGAERLHEENVIALFAIASGPMALEEAMRRADPLLTRAAEQVMRLVAMGRR